MAKVLGGYLLSVMCGVLFTTNKFLVQYFSFDIGEVLLLRSVFEGPFLLILLWVKPIKNNLLGDWKRIILLLCVGFLDAMFITMAYLSLQYLTIGDAQAIYFSQSAWILMIETLVGRYEIKF